MMGPPADIINEGGGSMFDALTNFIVYLETALQKTDDPAEVLEIIRILKTARKLQARHSTDPARIAS
jgi:hypothetical protein